MTFYPGTAEEIEEPEFVPPMFERGIVQCLYWSYAMQMPTVDPHERSPHAVLMMKQMDGYLQEFSVKTIHLEELTDLEKFGEAQLRRKQIERIVTERQKNWIWSKYICDINVPEKFDGMKYISWYIYRHPKMNYSTNLVADCLCHIVATKKQSFEYTMEIIAEKNHVSYEAVRWAVKKIRKITDQIEQAAFRKLRPVFWDANII